MPFTSETARQATRKGHVTRRLNKARALLLPANQQQLEPFIRDRLVSVREQLNKLDAMMAGTTDPKVAEKISAAQARLAIQEREMAGRPTPGQFRPEKERPRRGGQILPMPLDAAR